MYELYRSTFFDSCFQTTRMIIYHLPSPLLLFSVFYLSHFLAFFLPSFLLRLTHPPSFRKIGAFLPHPPVQCTPAHFRFRDRQNEIQIVEREAVRRCCCCWCVCVCVRAVFCIATLWVIYGARGSSICCKGVIFSIPQLPLLPPQTKANQVLIYRR